MLCSWEGNCRSGITLAMGHRLSGISTYKLMANWKAAKQLPTLLQRVTVQFTLHNKQSIILQSFIKAALKLSAVNLLTDKQMDGVENITSLVVAKADNSARALMTGSYKAQLTLGLVTRHWMNHHRQTYRSRCSQAPQHVTARNMASTVHTTSLTVYHTLHYWYSPFQKTKTAINGQLYFLSQ